MIKAGSCLFHQFLWDLFSLRLMPTLTSILNSACVLSLSACFCQRVCEVTHRKLHKKGRNGRRQTDVAESGLQLGRNSRSVCSFSPLHLELHMFQIMSHAMPPLSMACSSASWEHQGEMPPQPDVNAQPKSSHNMSPALLESLPPLSSYWCEWWGKCEKSASTRKSNLTLQWQPRGWRCESHVASSNLMT